MNFKKTWKRFFTVSRASEGFTLVELIVVIAILAILAGIAVPAYSGYIKKANKAADLQLLGAVNTAFAAACLENNVDVNTLTPATAKMPLTGTEGAMSVDQERVAPYSEAFKRYFAGNTGSFKVITQLIFSNGAFHDPASAPAGTLATGTYGNTTLYFSQSAIDSVNASTFGDIGGTNLLNQVDYVAGFASAMSSATFDNILGNADYQRSFLQNVGADLTGITDENIGEYFDGFVTQMAIANVGEDADDDAVEAAKSNIKANMAVLYAAQNSTTSQEDMITLLSGENVKSQIVTNMSTNPGEGLSQAATAYGMYYAYAQATNQTGLVTGKTPVQVLNSFEADAGFRQWITGEEAEADLNAYYSAMDMISTGTTGNTQAVQDLMLNGFGYNSTTGTGNQALHDLINEVLGTTGN